jgi:hypothetical protein
LLASPPRRGPNPLRRNVSRPALGKPTSRATKRTNSPAGWRATVLPSPGASTAMQSFRHQNCHQVHLSFANASVQVLPPTEAPCQLPTTIHCLRIRTTPHRFLPYALPIRTPAGASRPRNDHAFFLLNGPVP